MTNPIWAEEAFESSYGFHYIGISSASDYTYADPEEKVTTYRYGNWGIESFNSSIWTRIRK